MLIITRLDYTIEKHASFVPNTPIHWNVNDMSINDIASVEEISDIKSYCIEKLKMIFADSLPEAVTLIKQSERYKKFSYYYLVNTDFPIPEITNSIDANYEILFKRFIYMYSIKLIRNKKIDQLSDNDI